MQLSFKLLDYDTNSPLANKQVEIRNISSNSNMIYPIKTSSDDGSVSFDIQDIHKADFFIINLVNETTYYNTPFNLANNKTQFIITPNNYQNKYAKVYFKARIYLYFNGNTLKILKDKIVLKEFSANYYSQDKILNNAIYYISTKEIQNIYNHTQIQNNVIESTNKDSNNTESKHTNYTKDSIQSNKNIINIYKDKDLTHIKSSIEFIENIESNHTKQDSIILNNNLQHYFVNTLYTNIQQHIDCIECKIESIKEDITQIIIHKTDSNIDSQKVYADITKPFAPGTYIEFKLIDNNINKINWSFAIAFNDERLQEIKSSSKPLKLTKLVDSNGVNQAYNVNIINSQNNEIIGFSLPLEKLIYPSSKYYIIIFAHQDIQPTIKDSHVIIDMSFQVGEDSREIKEKETRANLIYKYDTKSINQELEKWNTLDSINSLQEAIELLRFNYDNYDRFLAKYKKLTFNYFNYYQAYPQLAGKLAYICYRFDLIDEKFIKNITSTNIYDCINTKHYIKNNTYLVGQEYLDDRIDFAEKIAMLYNDKYKQKFERAYIKQDETINKENLMTNFINSIHKTLKIKNDVPILEILNLTIEETNTAGVYNSGYNTLTINANVDLKQLIDTIVHEYRHFYINYVVRLSANHNLKNNIILHFIYYTYFNASFAKIFDMYNKECAKFDKEANVCNNKTYKESNSNSSPLYYISPKERDARIVANMFITKIYGE